ncbi:MAG: M48 family metallopeptidase [Gemmatimonadetes bacterium]|nr:M48 family metallopeptidase [Gammaproteobacteria bacterium]MYD26758.1 M48 family metallopeptidase [Gemmatimonadota bacterium]
MNVDYKVKRSSKRKKLTITVERNRQIVISAPTSTSEEVIREFFESKRQWIYEKTNHLQKYEARPHPPGKEIVNGESALYLGYEYQIEIYTGDTTEIRLEQRFLVPSSLVGERRKVFHKWYVDRAKEYLIPKVKSFGSTLGVEFASAKIMDSRYRWGSCTVKNNINLNWRLIKAPMFVIDYVIVHELAHLMEANHTSRFWNIVRTHAPLMEKAQRWLKENGQILEQDI